MAQVSLPVSHLASRHIHTEVLKMDPDTLSQMGFDDSLILRHKRRDSNISSTSIRSSDSWPTLHSEDTTATDIALTTSRSRTNTGGKAEEFVSAGYMPCKPPIKIVLGTASVGSAKSPLAKITTVEELQKFITTFRARGYADIDTARAYPVGRGGTCEQLLGEKILRMGTWANTSTKVSSFMPGAHKARHIEHSIDKSLEALDADSVDIMYLHAPDKATPFVETCKAINEAYEQGKFERFGLSNYSVEQVEEIVGLCEENGFIKPSVYQGQYNPICRSAESRLFEVLREHGIAFYAYSPSACGFFSHKVSRASANDKNSRWNIASPLGAKYTNDYFHDALFAAAEAVRDEAQQYGISGHAAALRWTTWHSFLAAEDGDALIIGASNLSQLEENLDILEQGPLPEPLVETMDQIWDKVKALEKGPRFSFV